MQPKDSSIFADVSDYFGIDNPAIAEKDYYVVQLLKLLASHYCQHHTMGAIVKCGVWSRSGGIPV